MSSFAENIKRIRLEKQMSQEDFAKLLGTSKQNISRYELGAVSPKITTAAKFANILNISLSELNGEDHVFKSYATQAIVDNSCAYAENKRRSQLYDLVNRIPDGKIALAIRILESILDD